MCSLASGAQGGYNLRATAAATEACLRALLGQQPPALPGPKHPTMAGMRAIRTALQVCARRSERMRAHLSLCEIVLIQLACVVRLCFLARVASCVCARARVCVRRTRSSMQGATEVTLTPQDQSASKDSPPVCAGAA